MTFGKCEKCGEYGFTEEHECKPQWEALYVDYDNMHGAMPEGIFEIDPERAATKYADDNYARFNFPNEMEIWVRRPREEWIKFDIEVETIPIFLATEL